MNRTRLSRRLPALSAILSLAALLATPPAQALTPQQILNDYTAQAGAAPQPARGQQLFTASHGREWRCASCHGVTPTQAGQHAATGKPIGPMAPAFNAQRFTDPAKVEKWFRRNCNDVLGRACSAQEKSDVLSWLMTLK